MLEQLIRKPTTFVTAVWIFQVVSLDIGRGHRKQNCYQRALRNPNQTGCHRGSNHSWSKEVTELKGSEPQSLAKALHERKRCLHIFWSKHPTPLHCDESLLVFDGILFLMAIKSAAKFCTRHLLLEPKRCESAWAEYLYLSAVGGVCFCAIKIKWRRFLPGIEYIII